jgi:hypothetical protein
LNGYGHASREIGGISGAILSAYMISKYGPINCLIHLPPFYLLAAIIIL